jgi:hypothetical protein
MRLPQSRVPVDALQGETFRERAARVRIRWEFCDHLSLQNDRLDHLPRTTP